MEMIMIKNLKFEGIFPRFCAQELDKMRLKAALMQVPVSQGFCAKYSDQGTLALNNDRGGEQSVSGSCCLEEACYGRLPLTENSAVVIAC